MDRIDRDILKILKKNPLKPFLKVAKEIGISPSTALNRYEKLKMDDVIFGASIIIDVSKIGYQGKAFLLVTFTNSCYEENSATEALRSISNVFLISEIIGTFDVLAMVVFKDLTDIKELIGKIRALHCVKKVEVILTNDTLYPLKEEYKDCDYFPPENVESS
jgi:Lrp/AsnC family leucine-responsive transcriptional regulator